MILQDTHYDDYSPVENDWEAQREAEDFTDRYYGSDEPYDADDDGLDYGTIYDDEGF
jgi:hypothetical protein